MFPCPVTKKAKQKNIKMMKERTKETSSIRPKFHYLPQANGRIINIKMSWHLINELSFIKELWKWWIVQKHKWKILLLIKLNINPCACLPSAWNPHPPTLHIQIHLPSVRSCPSNSPTYPSWGRMRFLPIIPLVLASKYNYLFIALYLLLIWSSASTFYFPATNRYRELLNKILLNKWIILKIAFPIAIFLKTGSDMRLEDSLEKLWQWNGI